MTCITLVLQKCLMTSAHKVSIFWWNILEKSSKHCHFTRQIVCSRNHLFLFCPIFGNPSSCTPIDSVLNSFKLSQS